MTNGNDIMITAGQLCLYRAVSDAEFYSIMRTNQFSLHPKGAQVKYFGLSFIETVDFANKVTNLDAIAIMEVIISKETIDRIGDFTHVDPFIFRSGTVIIPAGDLNEFSQAIIKIIHKY
ncbi:MAG: hypothetical protein FWG88_02355 [Oscillospiraceae bacterium]|nr:hypothetical protein [Oscillospiraceae bacterium]